VADDEAGTMLLTDIRAIFEDKGNPDVLPSGVIIDTLTGLEHRPWAEWSKGRPLSPAKLARLLAGYDIHPGSTRIGDKVVRAYRYVTFTDAWERYKTLEVLQRNNPNQNGHELAASKCYTPNACSTLQSATNPTNVEVSSGVALSKVEVADQGMADGELF
jgi:hypothetical protein